MPILGRVLAEGGESYAVLEGDTAELERLEEFWDGGIVWLRIRGGS
jgi:hypothetical protein